MNELDALKFCDEVRTMFFNPKPTEYQIYEAIETYKGQSLKPQDIAKRIAEKRREEFQSRKNKKRVYYSKSSKTSKKSTESESGLISKPKAPKRKKRRIPKKKTTAKEKYSRFRYPHDPRDYQENVKKCRHGIPKYQICGICNPDEFRKETGLD